MNDMVQYQMTNALVPKSIDEAINLSNTLAKAQLVPAHLQGKPGDCLLIVMQAQRWGMDVLSVAQCTSVVHGRLCYEGKLVAAVLYSMGAVDGRLHYEIKGEGQKASITVTGTPRGGQGPQSLTGSVAEWRTWGKDKQGNPMKNAWDSIPEDMLVYRGTRQWARRYAPEALLGVYTPDEIEDVETGDVPQKQATPQPQSKSAKVEKHSDAVDAELVDDKPKQEAKPAPNQTAQASLPPALSDGMLKVLNSKLATGNITMEALVAGFGDVTPANINQAFKWIGEQKS